MNKIILALISGLILTFSTHSQADSLNNKDIYSPKEITFATYNVENLFDGIQNQGKKPETAKPEKELIALAEAIKEINADIITVQEVETKEVLENFVRKYLPDTNYQVVLVEGNDSRGIDVGIITRLQVLDVKSHKDAVVALPSGEKTVLSRDLLEVKLKANDNYVFTSFVTHLKSHHGGDIADIRREAEAETVRKIVSDFSKQNPNANFTLSGDFNDIYSTKALKPILKSDLNLTDIIFKDLGTANYVYTYHPVKFRSRIDYILVSPGMMKEYINKSVFIHKISDINSNKFIFLEASDHLPVTAKFNVSQDL